MLLIVVGQAGMHNYVYSGGGGGGATFVLTADQSLVVAGGGGGGLFATLASPLSSTQQHEIRRANTRLAIHRGSEIDAVR